MKARVNEEVALRWQNPSLVWQMGVDHEQVSGAVAGPRLKEEVRTTSPVYYAQTHMGNAIPGLTPEKERGEETGGQRTPGTLTASALPASISQEGGDSPLPGKSLSGL